MSTTPQNDTSCYCPLIGEIKYEKALKYSIENFWSSENQKKLKLQYEIMKSTYSWDVRAIEWKNFFNDVRK